MWQAHVKQAILSSLFALCWMRSCVFGGVLNNITFWYSEFLSGYFLPDAVRVRCVRSPGVGEGR